MKIFNEILLEDFGDEIDFKIFLKNSNRAYIKNIFFKPFKNRVYRPLAKIIREQKSLNFYFTKIRNLNQFLNNINKEEKPILDTYKWQCNSKAELKDFLFYVLFDPHNSINSEKFQICLKVQFKKSFKYNEKIWQFS